jgi:hypothetical protein
MNRIDLKRARNRKDERHHDERCRKNIQHHSDNNQEPVENEKECYLT